MLPLEIVCVGRKPRTNILTIRPRYLICDRDAIYGAAVTRRLRAMGIRDKPIAPCSPWQNCFAERLIGSIRRECVDHVIALGEQHLRRVLNYAIYYKLLHTAHLAMSLIRIGLAAVSHVPRGVIDGRGCVRRGVLPPRFAGSTA